MEQNCSWIGGGSSVQRLVLIAHSKATQQWANCGPGSATLLEALSTTTTNSWLGMLL
ncbi:hypothetical protein SynMINOS11_00773 [Synechococcus sp. Minos11]|nr:hypothetical protein SynMINOS11_00773 [Synechococcus sp. Minos11]